MKLTTIPFSACSNKQLQESNEYTAQLEHKVNLQQQFLCPWASIVKDRSFALAPATYTVVCNIYGCLMDVLTSKRDGRRNEQWTISRQHHSREPGIHSRMFELFHSAIFEDTKKKFFKFTSNWSDAWFVTSAFRKAYYLSLSNRTQTSAESRLQM